MMNGSSKLGCETLYAVPAFSLVTERVSECCRATVFLMNKLRKAGSITGLHRTALYRYCTSPGPAHSCSLLRCSGLHTVRSAAGPAQSAWVTCPLPRPASPAGGKQPHAPLMLRLAKGHPLLLLCCVIFDIQTMELKPDCKHI